MRTRFLVRGSLLTPSLLVPLLLPLLGSAACGGSDDSGAAPGSGADATTDAVASGSDSGPPGTTGMADGGPSSPGDAQVEASAPGDGGIVCSDMSASKNVYWGDLHTHTALSADAYSFGTRNSPLDAYEFAMGQPKQIAAAASPAGPISHAQALDWDAVTDHSEWLAATKGCGDEPDGGAFDPQSSYYSTKACSDFRGVVGDSLPQAIRAANLVQKPCGGEDQGQCAAETQSAWQEEQAAVHTANQPCTFTSLAAYEWTHEDMAGATLHHNVIFSTEQVPALPFDSLNVPSATALWTSLDSWKATTPACQADPAACQVMTIPHNSNLSSGLAFELPTTDAGTIDPAGVALMAKYQTMVEIHQHKGSSECYAGQGSTDPSCAFEHLQFDAGATPAENAGTSEDPKNFVRSALGKGIALYQAERDAGAAGVNPLQLGIVGATDDHNGMPGNVAEDSYPGHAGLFDDTAALRLAVDGGVNEAPYSYFNPGGITGVWAEQNTRDRIYAALARRETFATSGPRIALRFYQTWSTQSFCGGGFPGNVLAAGGIPMGGTIAPAGADGGTASASPHFVINALKDQVDLAEVDLVKISIVNGAAVEQVVQTTLTGTQVQAPCVEWTDPAFTAGTSAVYYVRVLQAPTMRWSSYDCQVVPGTPGCEPGGRLSSPIQERAWTSPIWWMP